MARGTAQETLKVRPARRPRVNRFTQGGLASVCLAAGLALLNALNTYRASSGLGMPGDFAFISLIGGIAAAAWYLGVGLMLAGLTQEVRARWAAPSGEPAAGGPAS